MKCGHGEALTIHRAVHQLAGHGRSGRASSAIFSFFLHASFLRSLKKHTYAIPLRFWGRGGWGWDGVGKGMGLGMRIAWHGAGAGMGTGMGWGPGVKGAKHLAVITLILCG